MADRTESTSMGDAAPEPPGQATQEWTVEEVRAAIARVGRGEFDAVGAFCDSSTFDDRNTDDDRDASDEADGATRRAEEQGPARAEASGLAQNSSAVDGEAVSPRPLLEDWAASSRAADRIRAAEVARLGAFVLARVLARRDGDVDLIDFLATPVGDTTGEEGSSPDAAGVEVFEDHRLSTRARALLDPADAIIVAAKLNTRLDFARRAAARAVVAFIGLHSLLESAATGRVRFERVERLHGRIDDALLPVDEVLKLDGFLADLSPQLSLDQFEKLARRRIRTLTPVLADPEAPRKQRCVRYERFDDGTARLELHGPILVLEGLYQRLSAMARSIRRNQLESLESDAFGQVLDSRRVQQGTVDERTVAQLMFDLLTASRLHTQVRVTGQRSGAARGDAEKAPGAAPTDPAAAAEELIDVFCPTDGDWLRKQAAVTITVPITTVLSLDDSPGMVNGDVPLAAEQCREAAAHATSWFRVLTDPATSIVTDHVAHTYEPTAAMRRTVRQKWRTCTVPGCSQPSQWCEIEHCCRFSKLNPATGGLTVMENLHPMCKHHHGLKTDGVIQLEQLGRNEACWVLPMGVRARKTAPPVAIGDDAVDPGTLLTCADERDKAREVDEPGDVPPPF